MLVATPIILIILLIIIVILVVPFHIYLTVYNADFKIKGTFKLTWMKLKLIQREIPPEKPAEKKADEKKNRFEISRIPKLFHLLIESWPYLERVFNGFLKSTYFEIFSLNLRLGLGDAYNTAIISGYFWAAASLLNNIPQASISLDPDFVNERIDMNMDLKVKIMLFWIAIEFIRAFTKKPVRMLFKELRGING